MRTQVQVDVVNGPDRAAVCISDGSATISATVRPDPAVLYDVADLSNRTSLGDVDAVGLVLFVWSASTAYTGGDPRSTWSAQTTWLNLIDGMAHQED